MSLNATVRARVDERLKQEAENIFSTLGLNTSQAINIFLKKVVLEHGIPFDLKVPNAKTLKAMEEAKKMDGDFISLDEMKHA